ncbi:unnamed protein product [Cylindrotheca closterium]|uniref:Alkaline phosphatase n=1 Tax=Cylindrotheca closterium TaxID=2856 RepID=A0AAD2G9V5_9STRA|nr:unnamed protein product [Cylindrotheca closterium]
MKLVVLAFLIPLVIAENFSSEGWNPKLWEDFLEAMLNGGHSPKPKNARKRNLQTEVSEPILADSFGGEPGFYHGVASGDPLEDRVILWTKYTPISANETVFLELRMAEVTTTIPLEDHLDPDKNDYLWTKTIRAEPGTDYIAKIDVTGLDSNKHYVYAFTDFNIASDVGQTRTAPSADDDEQEMNYCFFSCSNFASGYFHPYDICSTMEDLDFWIHVGDYIYESGYGNGGFGGGFGGGLAEREEVALPQWEVLNLQDYRNRYATHHRYDEGLRNIRRRAPVIAIWDDHEFANNAYGKDSDVGASNHQEVCDEVEDEEEPCRPEGDAVDRFNMASQAYLEWMPIRLSETVDHPTLNISSITQIIEWGSLATVVAVDTRMTERSKEATLYSTLTPFQELLVNETDVDSYYNESSPSRQKIDEVAEAVMANLSNPEHTMLGDTLRNLVLDTFQNSKDAGKPWQIFAQQVVMGNQLPPNFHKLADYAPEENKVLLQNFVGAGLQNPQFGTLLRGLVAMSIKKISLNSDAWDGFAHERALLLEGLRTKTNNPIVLGGDSHDSWAYSLVEDGGFEGEKIAVNINAPAVTSGGYGRVVGALFGFIAGAIGGIENLLKIVQDSLLADNSGLLYADINLKGFVAVTATKEKHVSEYILVETDTMEIDYAAARGASDNITASFKCDASLVTAAGEPGSLSAQDGCEIAFDSKRPEEWSIPVPVSGGSSRCDTSERLSGCDFTACELDASEFERPPEVKSDASLRSATSAAVIAFCMSLFMV